MRQLTCFLFAAVWIGMTGQALPGQKIPPDRNGENLSFSRTIRPILSKHCYACHGPDEGERKAGLRLDIPNEDIDLEYLAERIRSSDAIEVMPPPHANKPLSEEKIKLLESWIEQGGNYENHWAFEQPTQTEVPAEQHPIDHFIDQRLAQEKLQRSPPADPATLIRRVYLDLIGLPPTLEQADSFLTNPSPENFATIVDELLASPRYGEKWAGSWLDLARYADTNGFEKDRDRSIWLYRDWVIQSLNQDMPFNQFTIEQLAGDMLRDPTPSQLVATGFHRNTMLNEEGGIDPLEYRYYAMVDRVGTTGATWLGLTTACAQCHTHKFDPITHTEYFGMMAYLDNADEPDYFVAPKNSEEQRRQNEQAAQKQLRELPQHWPVKSESYDGPTFDEAFQVWLEHQQQAVADWRTIVPESLESNLPHLSLEPEGIVLASGDTTKHDTYTLSFPAIGTATTALRLEALPDIRLPGLGPGMTFYEGRKGDFFLAEIRIELPDGTNIPVSSADQTFANNQFGNSQVSATLACDGDFQTGWSIAGRFGERHVALFNLAERIPPNTEFKIVMEFGRHFASSLGKFRLSVTESGTPLSATLLDNSQLKTVARTSAKNSVKLKQAFAMQAKQLAAKANEIRRLKRPIIGTPTMVMRERPDNQRRETYFRNRGEFTQPQHVVVPHLPSAIFPNDNSLQPKNRLEFARWLVSPSNPLTARVVANRHWAEFFDRGIVETVDDFGMQGQPPSHPKLLDYLAIHLMNEGWSIKQLHRLIVTSKTYQQSSKRESNVSSPLNELLQSFPRKRLKAEVIRDVSLFSSGLLSEKMFGRPVRPPQPAGAAANFSRSTWATSQGEDRYRRSIYTYQKRTAPFAMFTTFDAGSREACLARRDASNTPLQALTLMNDPMFVEIAEALGKRMESIQGDTPTKISTGFRWLLTRRPDEEELAMLLDFHQKHNDWNAVARILLCLDESITKN